MELFRVDFIEQTKPYSDFQAEFVNVDEKMIFDSYHFLDNQKVVEQFDLGFNRQEIKANAIKGHLASCISDLITKGSWNLCFMPFDLSDQYVAGLLFEEADSKFEISYGFIEGISGTDSRIPGNLIRLNTPSVFKKESVIGNLSESEILKMLFESYSRLVTSVFVEYDKFEVIY